MYRDGVLNLYGSDYNKALQLAEVLKNRELTPEQLDRILPYNKEFYTSFVEIIKRQLENDKECNARVIEALTSTLNLLSNLISNERSADVRPDIIRAIEKISENIKEIEIARANNSGKFKSLLAILITLVLSIIAVLAGKISDNKRG